MIPLTRAVGRFAARGAPDALPDAAVATVCAGFADLVACILAGREQPAVGILERYERGRGAEAGPASLCFTERRASAETAALVNGTAGHVLDYDDVGLIAHPSAVLVPAVLAEGERLGASGEAVVRAYLVGYEVWAELVRREPDPYHRKGWHPTSVLGTVAAAAAVAALNRQDEATAVRAVGIAASLAGGVAANFGSMTKPFHAGRAAASGVAAAALAAAGMTAAEDALEHPGGLLAALSPGGRVDLGPPPESFGRELAILRHGLSFKKYPNCYATHRVVDATLDLAGRHELRAAEVESVTAWIGPTQAAILRNARPGTALEARFSLEFAVAAALVAGAVSLRELTDEFVARPEVQDLVARVTVELTDGQCPLEPAFGYADRLAIRCRDGRLLDSGEIRFARGHAQRPLEPGESRQKFEDCCAATGFTAVDELWEKLARLPALRDVRELRVG